MKTVLCPTCEEFAENSYCSHCRKKIISRRKPYNQDAGYIASLRSGMNKGWVVIYNAKEAGIDDKEGKYAVVCQTHNTIVNTTSLPKSRTAMKAVDFCEECMAGKDGYR